MEFIIFLAIFVVLLFSVIHGITDDINIKDEEPKETEKNNNKGVKK